MQVSIRIGILPKATFDRERYSGQIKLLPSILAKHGCAPLKGPWSDETAPGFEVSSLEMIPPILAELRSAGFQEQCVAGLFIGHRLTRRERDSAKWLVLEPMYVETVSLEYEVSPDSQRCSHCNALLTRPQAVRALTVKNWCDREVFSVGNAHWIISERVLRELEKSGRKTWKENPIRMNSATRRRDNPGRADRYFHLVPDALARSLVRPTHVQVENRCADCGTWAFFGVHGSLHAVRGTIGKGIQVTQERFGDAYQRVPYTIVSREYFDVLRAFARFEVGCPICESDSNEPPIMWPTDLFRGELQVSKLSLHLFDSP